MEQQGRIITSLGGFYQVALPSGELLDCRAKGKFRKDQQKPLVGDLVRVEQNDQGLSMVSAILPRKNQLVRPPLANLDQLVLVTSLADPAPNRLVLDQLIAVAEHQSIAPVVVFTKADLADAQSIFSVYQKAGFPTFAVREDRPDTAQPIRELLKGKITAFTGNTGVGKSTLLNRLYPQLHLDTGEISKKLGRGRHTTRQVMLYALPEGGYAADTPGFSAMDFLRYVPIRKEELADCFREFAPYVDRCRFTGCSHTVEKGCAVLAALEAGEIAPSRHESYCELYRQAQQIKDWQWKEEESGR